MSMQILNSLYLCCRPDVKAYHYVGDFFNILKAFIGTNYQALPFAFQNSGVIVSLHCLFSYLCIHSLDIGFMSAIDTLVLKN